MHIGVVTLFPAMFSALSDYGISGRAIRSNLVNLEFSNPREFATDKHRTVDDRPFGGGPGMLMKTDTLMAAIRAARSSLTAADSGLPPRTVYLSPQGQPLDHKKVTELAKLEQLLLVCGRYQGIDNRIVEAEIDEELSLGDFVISGGELAAMVLIDALIRLQPGALGDHDSALQDSFTGGLLHCPEYTRPQEYEGSPVPATLLSGNHDAIAAWQLKQSLGTTWLKRPDLLEKIELSQEQQELLNQFKNEFEAGH